MTCDDLFDLLTGERRADNHECRDAMKRHLARCRSCRRLADAFEPAVELFRECQGADDFLSAPAFDGPWNEPSDEEVQEFRSHRAGTNGRAAIPWISHFAGADLLRLAAALLVGLTVGAFVWGQSQTPATGNAPLAISASPGASGGTAPRITLAAVRLTSDCLPAAPQPADAAAGPRLRSAGELLAAADLDSLACCTLCHASRGLMSHTRAATLQVVRSCQACHDTF